MNSTETPSQPNPPCTRCRLPGCRMDTIDWTTAPIGSPEEAALERAWVRTLEIDTKILASLQGGIYTTAHVARTTGASLRTVQRRLRDLHYRRLVRHEFTRNRFMLTWTGEWAVASAAPLDAQAG